MMLLPLDFPKISPPDISQIAGSGIIDTVVSFLQFFFTLIMDLCGAVVNFYQMLIELNVYINDLIVAAQNGTVRGLPLLGAIGTYRYLVTDPIFYLTYMIVLFGCLFTIYQLILLLLATYKSLKESISGGTVSATGIASLFAKWFT